jgi:predicted ABC-type ATPase
VIQFVNANEIAKGLSPFAPETVALQAGKLMLKRLQELIAEKENFGFETTLTTLSYKSLLNQARQKRLFHSPFIFMAQQPSHCKTKGEEKSV